MQAKEYKVMVIGPRSGKTTFIQSLFTSCQRIFPTTLGVSVTPYDMGTFNKQNYRVNFWEVGSKYTGLGKEYCTDADIAIIFMDDANEYKKYEKWIPINLPTLYIPFHQPSSKILKQLWYIITKYEYLLSDL